MSSILLIEDDPSSLLLFKTLLELQHYRVVPVSSRADALAALETGAYDMILLDMHLRDGIAFDVLQVMEEERHPVIVMSANERYELNCRQLDHCIFLQKPISPQILLKTLARLHTSQC